MTRPPQFFLYGDTPVMFRRTPSGGIQVLVFDTSTRAFFADSTYRSRVLHDRDNLTRIVDEAEFNAQVEALGEQQVA
jgi:hypothetical protein